METNQITQKIQTALQSTRNRRFKPQNTTRHSTESRCKRKERSVHLQSMQAERTSLKITSTS